MAITITTNNHRRPIVYGAELPADAREDFDYLTDDELATRRFVQYRDEWHDLDDVLVAPQSLMALGWDGFNSDSHATGVAFRYFDEAGYCYFDHDETVVVGYVVITDD